MSLFTSIKCIGGRIDYPFKNEGDTTTKIYVLQCICDANVYAPAADDDTMTNAASAGVDALPAGFTDAAAYWVGDSDPVELNGPIVKFERSFSNIPQDRTRPFGLYAYTRPGIDQSISFGNYAAVWSTGGSTSKSFTNSPEPRVTLTIPASPARNQNFEVGDRVQIFNDNLWNMDSGAISSKYLVGTILTVSTNTFTINDLFRANASFSTQLVGVTIINSDNSATEYIMGKVLPEREQFALNVPAFREISYIKTSAPEDVSLTAAEDFLTSEQAVTTQLTDTTVPNITDYLNDLQDKVSKQIENESIDQWKGNIYQKIKLMGRIPLPNV